MNNVAKYLINLVATTITVAIIMWLCDGNTNSLICAFGSVLIFHAHETSDNFKETKQ